MVSGWMVLSPGAPNYPGDQDGDMRGLQVVSGIVLAVGDVSRSSVGTARGAA